MENTSETSESANRELKKVDLNRFDLVRWSRWTDSKGRLLVLAGFYHGKDPTKIYSTGFDRIAVDILNVHEEKVEYMDIGRFVHFIIHKKIMPWKDRSPITLNQESELNMHCDERN